MAMPERRMEIRDVQVLAALAHPLRVALIDQLAAFGPRTASQCAQALAETPANCSYHLRRLARFGLVDRVEATDGRERPWRLAYTGLSLGPALGDPQRDPAARATWSSLVAIEIEQNTVLARSYLRLLDRVDPAWRDAAAVSGYSLLLTAAELRALVEALDRAIRPYIGLTREQPPEGARPVHLDLKAFLRPEELA